MDLFVGVDVASRGLVAYNEVLGFREFENVANSIRPFLKSLPKGSLLAIESTGGYGSLMVELAMKAGFTVYMVQPAKVKRFRESSPDKGKTDRIDAKAIHEYLRAFLHRLHAYRPLAPFEARLRKLSRTRQALVDKISSIKVQLRALGDSPATIKVCLCSLEDRLARLTIEIQNLLLEAPESKVLSRIAGVGDGVISAVLPALRTIPFRSKYALDSFAGMDLKPNESGRLKGRRRMSKEGDRRIRRAMYMAAMSASRTKAWRSYYLWLIESKKLTKIQALCALARKLLHTVYGVYRTQTRFRPCEDLVQAGSATAEVC